MTLFPSCCRITANKECNYGHRRTSYAISGQGLQESSSQKQPGTLRETCLVPALKYLSLIQFRDRTLILDGKIKKFWEFIFIVFVKGFIERESAVLAGCHFVSLSVRD